MSHKITTSTEIKDIEVAKVALARAKISFKMTGSSTLQIMGGPLTGVTINTLTGLVTGDTDFQRRDPLDTLNTLRDIYAEELVRMEVFRNGGFIESRQVLDNGDIVLVYQIG